MSQPKIHDREPSQVQAAEQKLQAMHRIANRHGATHLGMPSFHDTVGRASA
jgi:hypothetical protein